MHLNLTHFVLWACIGMEGPAPSMTLMEAGP